MQTRRILIYTSPAQGHLEPAHGLAWELQQRGHQVLIKTLAEKLPKLLSSGLQVEAIDPAIEAIKMDDYQASNPLAAVKRAITTFARRAPLEVLDLERARTKFQADMLVIDTNCFGARSAAEASGLPWCVFQPFLSPLPGQGVPAFGPGLRLREDLVGKLRDAIASRLVTNTLARITLNAVNPIRQSLALQPFEDYPSFHLAPPKTLYLTSKAFDYPRSQWPSSFVFCGPVNAPTEPAKQSWLEGESHPVILVTCSTEAQADRAIIDTSLRALANQPYQVLASSAAHAADDFESSENCRIERYLPHDAILPHCAAVICHGGMGITQKALQAGVPVCVVPFGRDQLEVARRLEQSGAGVCLMPKQLRPDRLRQALEVAIQKKPQAQAMARAFSKTAGAVTACDAILQLAT